MDLTNEVGGAVADTASSIFTEKLLPRALSEGNCALTEGDPPQDTDVGRFIKFLAAELSSPDHHVRTQVYSSSSSSLFHVLQSYFLCLDHFNFDFSRLSALYDMNICFLYPRFFFFLFFLKLYFDLVVHLPTLVYAGEDSSQVCFRTLGPKHHRPPVHHHPKRHYHPSHVPQQSSQRADRPYGCPCLLPASAAAPSGIRSLEGSIHRAGLCQEAQEAEILVAKIGREVKMAHCFSPFFNVLNINISDNPFFSVSLSLLDPYSLTFIYIYIHT